MITIALNNAHFILLFHNDFPIIKPKYTVIYQVTILLESKGYHHFQYRCKLQSVQYSPYHNPSI